MSNILKYKGFMGSIEVDVEGDCLHGKVLFINDLITYEAETPSKLEEEFKASLDDYLETCKSLGRDPNKPFSGTFNVRIGPDLHQKVAQYAFVKKTSINDIVTSSLRCYIENTDIKEVVHTHLYKIEYKQNFDVDFAKRGVSWETPQISNILN